MYFKDRAEAGQKLGEMLAQDYRYENCAVIALTDGGVIVGAQIAAHLHCVLTMLVTDVINLPGEDIAIATIDHQGGFTYDNSYTPGQLDDYVNEYHGYIEQAKLEKMHEMNQLIGSGGIIERDILRDHNVILVFDGLNKPQTLEAAVSFLKPVRTESLIVVTPLASVPMVDKMHILADKIYCLSVVDNYIDTNHYYDDNTIPDQKTIIKMVQDIVLQWR